ncbi:TRAP transporter small permease [Pararhodobacter sp.]|uniref:TRAP transporter small permease n=1 Tax=Pararhodobacter sp. TaxID=2127056 RepID=UPI002FE38F54
MNTAKAFRPLSHLAAGFTLLLSLALIAMVLLACVNVALRYIWQVSLLWADETLVFGVIVLAFLGTITVSIQNRHLRMELLTRALSGRAAWALRLVELVVTAGVLGFTAWYSLAVTRRLWTRGTLSNMAEVPLWLINGAVLVGLTGMALVALAQLAGHLMQGRK